jgi:hypothetical protein
MPKTLITGKILKMEKTLEIEKPCTIADVSSD